MQGAVPTEIELIRGALAGSALRAPELLRSISWGDSAARPEITQEALMQADAKAENARHRR